MPAGPRRAPGLRWAGFGVPGPARRRLRRATAAAGTRVFGGQSGHRYRFRISGRMFLDRHIYPWKPARSMARYDRRQPQRRRLHKVLVVQVYRTAVRFRRHGGRPALEMGAWRPLSALWPEGFMPPHAGLAGLHPRGPESTRCPAPGPRARPGTRPSMKAMSAGIVILQLAVLGGPRIRPGLAEDRLVPGAAPGHRRDPDRALLFTSLPVSGPDLALQGAGALAGLVLGLVSVAPWLVQVSFDPAYRGRWARLTRRPARPAIVSQAGLGYALICIVVCAARLGCPPGPVPDARTAGLDPPGPVRRPRSAWA
jgi:hypothetical protein